VRKATEQPEMHIISRASEELSTDALSITDYEHWEENDYTDVKVSGLDDRLVRAGVMSLAHPTRVGAARGRAGVPLPLKNKMRWEWDYQANLQSHSKDTSLMLRNLVRVMPRDWRDHIL
jgi:hypothetical protein